MNKSINQSIKPHSTALEIPKFDLAHREDSFNTQYGQKATNHREHATNLKIEATQLLKIFENDAFGNIPTRILKPYLQSLLEFIEKNAVVPIH
jgi:hypothetical protein